jgi:putative hydroxymethylpyrimidine transport system substrate-binding protein
MIPVMIPGRLIRPLAVLLAVACAGAALTACGDSGDGGSPATAETEGSPRLSAQTKVTLVLDFQPNAVHAGIYRALAAGYYHDNNIELRIVQPTSTADTIKLIDAGKADFGIADAIDVAGQIEAGRPAKGIMAVVQRPLGGLITLAKDGIRSPAQLEGRKVGVTGVPSDDAVLNTIVADDGGDPDAVERVTIGFNGVQNLTTGKIAGFTGFAAADATQIEVQTGEQTRTFALDEHGGPTYPGLIVFAAEDRIRDEPDLARAFVDATVRGYQDTIDDPERSLDDLLAANPALDRKLIAAQLDAYVPLFQAHAPRFGIFQPRAVASLSRFLVDNDLASGAIPVARFATNAFLPRDGADGGP